MLVYVYLLVLVILWTLNPFLKKQLVSKINSEEYFFVNHIVVSIFVTLYFFYSYSKNKINYNTVSNITKMSKKELTILFIGGLFSVMSSRLLPHIISLKKDVSYLISNIQPIVIVLTAFIGYLFFQESLNRNKFIGIFLIVMGLFFVNLS